MFPHLDITASIDYISLVPSKAQDEGNFKLNDMERDETNNAGLELNFILVIKVAIALI